MRFDRTGPICKRARLTPNKVLAVHAISTAFPDEAAGVFLRDFTEVRAAQIFSEKRAAAATLGC